MKKTLTITILTVVIIGLSGLTSCKSKSSGTDQQKIAPDQVQSLESEIKKRVYPLPTSVDVIKMLSDLGVGYINGISNPVDNLKKESRRSERAVSLGVYGADLSYATIYNVQEDVIKYLGATSTLSNELNLTKIYDESLYERIKINAESKDSLIAILTEAFNKTYSTLTDNDQQALALLVVGGAWVEGMYLTTHVSEAAYHVAGISKILLEQKNSFDLYLEIAKPFAGDEGLDEFIKKLDPIKQVYSGLGTSLTNENIADITKAIEDIRSKII